LALFFYKKRKLEAASEPIAFLRLRDIFKYGATFCTMMVGGMYFSEVPYSDSLKKLSNEYQMVLILKLQHGLKENEIARLLRLKTCTVKTRIYRARKQLKQVFTASNFA
jgi:DNA-binding NarL/FixJ family response regulator